MSVSPALSGTEKGGSLELVSHQPNSRFMERPCLRGIRQRLTKDTQLPPLISVCAQVSYLNTRVCTHACVCHTHTHTHEWWRTGERCVHQYTQSQFLAWPGLAPCHTGPASQPQDQRPCSQKRQASKWDRNAHIY